MKEVNLNIVARDKTGKSNSKYLRNSGKIPAVIYGDKKEPSYIAIEYPKIVKELARTGFFSTVFNLKLDKKDIKVLPREIQTDPLNEKPVHIDFLRVNDNSKINISVPIIFINDEKSPGLKSGGVLNVVRREVDLICKIKNIPEKLEANLSNLEVGAVIHMSDIKLDEDVVPQISDRDFTIATIAAPTVMPVEEEKPETEGEEGEEGAEAKEGEEGAEVKEGEEGKAEEKKEDAKETEAKKDQDSKK
ncbi:MAG: 50S ribosomal protein L25 [Alphaproteobacteria bacterium MarineAlpha6_Bin4]|nr:MAG: 50S ribosomal protein L25 [Alphaproteobacteria bacterium MarineAlpha6_Bin3]PPR38116.1 MAG: 50S ribosomal protein L25 [Alphaproteobacteria bacterium MarineAlpha6_Bin4]|tara:strand:+ start:9025 stop:9765 length:741 start_codon:yes stop_codon:yes gene_type:complete